MKLKTALLVLVGLVAMILLPVVAGVLVGFVSAQQSLAPRPAVTIRYVDAPARTSSH